MCCELKSSIKLISNVIDKGKADKLGLYIPADLKKPEQLDSRVLHELTSQQKIQVAKREFYAKIIIDSDERFSDLPENKEMCENCEFKDKCY